MDNAIGGPQCKFVLEIVIDIKVKSFVKILFQGLSLAKKTRREGTNYIISKENIS